MNSLIGKTVELLCVTQTFSILDVYLHNNLYSGNIVFILEHVFANQFIVMTSKELICKIGISNKEIENYFKQDTNSRRTNLTVI